MSVKKLESGEWFADIRPNGAGGKRYRKGFPTKAEALRWEAWVKSHKTQRPDWEPTPKDSRKLSELIEKWHDSHGRHLKDGENRLLMVRNMCSRLKNPRASEIDADLFLAYRNERLSSGVSANTVNHEQTYLNAIFNELIRIGDWGEANPVAKVKKLKLDEVELKYLSLDEITELLGVLQGSTSDAHHIARICLATGARWGEAERITGEQVKPGLIRFGHTKNSKGRAVPIDAALYESLPQGKGRLFRDGYKTFQRLAEQCSFDLPKGQLTHVLRHTFASHFMMNGGNILTLQKILGHGSLNMTMRYAHLAPEHLEEAKRLNPLCRL